MSVTALSAGGVHPLAAKSANITREQTINAARKNMDISLQEQRIVPNPLKYLARGTGSRPRFRPCLGPWALPAAGTARSRIRISEKVQLGQPWNRFFL